MLREPDDRRVAILFHDELIEHGTRDTKGDTGHADGSYQDFLTGFVLPNGDVWGRPVGVTTANDGSILVTDDGSGSIWHITYTGK